MYVPHFPTQAIAEKPVLAFSSQPSDAGLRGYLDPRIPHAINSLLVQQLGNDEVVAVVRDDGDVDAFLVRHVVQALERRADSGGAIGVVADEIRPMFQENVESSAWGLAIHSQARILATSSNRHEVRIFKFGLLQDDDESSDENGVEEQSSLRNVHDDDDAMSPERSRQGQSSRKKDVTMHVINGNANIPYISFCNTKDDPEGRWLLTTDIGGFCRVMDLQQSTSNQTFRFGQSFAGANTGGFDRLNAGWTIMFLDRRSFKPEPSMNAALGMHNEESLANFRDTARIWDISRTIRNTPGVSEPFIYHRPTANTRNRPSLDIRSPGGQSAASSRVYSDDDSIRPPTASDSQGSAEIEIDVDDEQDDEMGSDDDGGGVDVEVEQGSTDDDDVASDGGPTDLELAMDEAMEALEHAEDEWQVGVVDDDDDPEDEGTEDTVAFTSFYNGDSVCGNEPRFARLEDGTICDDLPCPILHTSVRNIYLLQPSNQQNTEGPWTPPMVGLANPLRQPIQHDFEYLRMFERLNMSAQIPALGVVVVGSQKGRALVLALTKLSTDADYPPGTRDMSRMKTTYGMRIERVLPLASQEKKNDRPFAPLHGLAVGPMQGYEDVEDEKKRWRVMLMYQDHSILSYEVSRRTGNEGCGVDVDGLTV